jgi:hypothetical protein
MVVVNVAALLISWIGGFFPSKILDFRLPSLAGEPLIRVVGDGISISNSLFTMWLVMILIVPRHAEPSPRHARPTSERARVPGAGSWRLRGGRGRRG